MMSFLNYFRGFATLINKNILSIIKKNKEIIMYLIFGVLTTVISIVSYFLCTTLFLDPKNPLELQIANVISWVLSVSFAYVTNKLFVFESHGSILKEVVKFASSRLGTLAMEMILMYLLVTVLNFNDSICKISVQFVVIVANYILSKLLVFKEENK